MRLRLHGVLFFLTLCVVKIQRKQNIWNKATKRTHSVKKSEVFKRFFPFSGLIKTNPLKKQDPVRRFNFTENRPFFHHFSSSPLKSISTIDGFSDSKVLIIKSEQQTEKICFQPFSFQLLLTLFVLFACLQNKAVLLTTLWYLGNGNYHKLNCGHWAGVLLSATGCSPSSTECVKFVSETWSF